MTNETETDLNRIRAGMQVRVRGGTFEGKTGRALYPFKPLIGKIVTASESFEAEPSWMVQIGEFCLPSTVLEKDLEEVPDETR